MWPVLLGKGRGLQPQRRIRSDDKDTSVRTSHLAADRMAISQELPIHPSISSQLAHTQVL